VDIAPPPLDYEYAIERIAIFIKDFMAKAMVRGYVVGLSGGVDSSTTLALAVEAVGPEKIVALILPDKNTTPRQDVEDAVEVAEKYGVKYHVVEISNIIEAYMRTMPFADPNHKIATGNLRARVRMSILYYYANKYGYAVMGTGDKSEILLGYYTKYGDGGVDLLPIGDIYKTQVRELGRRLGIPEKIVKKPSSPRLWPGQLAEEELGARYEIIDAVLYRYVDLGMRVDEIVAETGIPKKLVTAIIKRVHANEHKRLAPLIPKISAVTPSPLLDWRMPWYSNPQF